MIHSPPWESLICQDSSLRYQCVTLLKNIAAIELRPAEDGRPSLSAITQLPRDSELQICGPGFNPRTVKVRSSGHYYFVFLQDLEEGSVTYDGEINSLVTSLPRAQAAVHPIFLTNI